MNQIFESFLFYFSSSKSSIHYNVPRYMLKGPQLPQNKERELYALLKLNEKYDRSLYLFGCYLFQKKKYAEGRTKFVQLLKSCYYNYSYFKQYADFEY